MGLKQARETSEKIGGKFVKLDDGESIILTFPWKGDADSDDPIVEETFYNEKSEQTEAFTDEHRRAGKTPNYKFKFGVAVLKKNKDKTETVLAEAMVLDCSNATFKTLLACFDKYGRDVWYEIKRSGSKKQTKYAVLYERDVEPADRKILADVKRPDMKDDNDAASTANGAGGSDGIISADEAKALKARLNTIPRDQIKTFLDEFKVEKIKDVKKSDLKRADEFITKLEKPAAANAAPAAAVAAKDPFAD